MEGMMEGVFWGAVVKKGKATEIQVDDGDILNITMATLGAKVGKERHVLVCEVAGSSFVICSLTAGLCENAPLNLRLSAADEAVLRLEGGSGEVHITGYKIALMEDEDMMDPFGGMGGSDEDDDDEDDDDESTDEEVRRNTLQNAMMSSAGKRKADTSGGPAKKAKVDDEEGVTGAKAREFGQLVQKHFFSEDVAADDDEDDEDFDEDDEEEGSDEDESEEDAKHVAFGGSSDEDESEDDEEEEQAAPPKKKHVDSKVQRVQTPKKPTTQPKTEATPKQQTPASKGKAGPQTPATAAKKPFACSDCNKTFAKEEGMLMHHKSVHKSA